MVKLLEDSVPTIVVRTDLVLDVLEGGTEVLVDVVVDDGGAVVLVDVTGVLVDTVLVFVGVTGVLVVVTGVLVDVTGVVDVVGLVLDDGGTEVDVVEELDGVTTELDVDVADDTLLVLVLVLATVLLALDGMIVP
jgi:hypothetical protein